MTKRELRMFEAESKVSALALQINIVPVLSHSLQGKVVTPKGTL